MEFEQIIELIRIVNESDMAEFQIQDRDFQLVIKSNRERTQKEKEPTIIQEAEVKLTAPIPETRESTRQVVKSPLVGIFHASAHQDAESAVNMGDTVEAGQMLGMIEAMKLMNEVLSEFSGKIVDILVQDGQQVEFGQPLFVIEE